MTMLGISGPKNAVGEACPVAIFGYFCVPAKERAISVVVTGEISEVIFQPFFVHPRVFVQWSSADLLLLGHFPPETSRETPDP